MTLKNHLDVRTPLIWVNSDEPDRVLDDVILLSTRPVYRIDAFNGLVVWRETGWKKVIVRLPDGSEGPSFDFQTSFLHVYEKRGLFIIPNAHAAAKECLLPLAELYTQYRDAYKENDAEKLPAQVVLISATGEIPPELYRHVAIINQSYPTVAQLAELALHINGCMEEPVLPEGKDLSQLVRAGQGLTESEFMQACLLSVKETKLIDGKFINDFKNEKIKQGGILEIRNPTISLDDIGGMDLAKGIINSIIWCYENPAIAAENDIVAIRKLLMIGVPGSGKSAICEAVAKSLGYELAKMGVSAMMSKWIGESEKNMRMAFKQIAAMAPLVCWVDEIGRDLSGSGSQNDAGTTDRVHGEFLTGLQELPDNVLFMAAANRIDGIPPEMLRADRFDRILFVGFPSEDEREDIFRIHLGERASEFDLNALAKATPMYTGAEIKALIKDVKFHVVTNTQKKIQTEDLLNSAPHMKNRVWIKKHDEMLAMYARALVEWDWASSAQRTDAQQILSGNIGSTQATGNSLVSKW